jgi:hypothetical protein
MTCYHMYESWVLQGENDMEVLEGAIHVISRFLTVVDQCAADVLQEHGIGSEWDEVNDIMEEMTCEACEALL